jgi:transcriptional regulator with XRE-family HTH domain
MPADFVSSIVPGLSTISSCSHITNLSAIAFVRTLHNDLESNHSHNLNMARRGVPKQINWYLREWMEATEAFKGRGGQERFREVTGWSKATMSQLYNNKQDYSPKLVNEAAQALSIAPYELLMHPEWAMAIRRLRQDALRVVEDSKAMDPPEAVVTKPRKRGNSR